MRRRVTCLQFCCLALLFAASAVRADPPKEKHPLEALGEFTILTSEYLHTPLTFPDDIKGHSFEIKLEGGKDKVLVFVSPTRWETSLFGDSDPVPPAGGPVGRWVRATLKPFQMPDPRKLDRRVYQIEAKELGERLFLVVPAKADGEFRLVARDKDGQIEAVMKMGRRKEQQPLQPCHPGCFPAGTKVATPDGLRAIETIKPGDKVLDISAAGKSAPMKVKSIFTGAAEMVELDTEAGKLITTAKQPFTLAAGGARSAGSLTAGDAIQRWQNGKIVAVKVRGVKKLEKPDRVFNLVLEERGTFVANGYLVRSKPPAE